jgi:Ricin-type beta-trefoil lectin domain
MTVRACVTTDHQTWVAGGPGELINLASGLCLDADAGTIGQENTLVQVWSCSGGLNQYWYFQFTPDL